MLHEMDERPEEDRPILVITNANKTERETVDDNYFEWKRIQDRHADAIGWVYEKDAVRLIIKMS